MILIYQGLDKHILCYTVFSPYRTFCCRQFLWYNLSENHLAFLTAFSMSFKVIPMILENRKALVVQYIKIK